MAEANEAAPQGTEATPQTTNAEVKASTSAPTQDSSGTPDINAEQVAKYFGTDPETLGKFQKFVEANGQFNAVFDKVKSKISNPEKTTEAPQTVSEPKDDKEPTSQPQQPVEAPKTPQGAITASEFLAEQYFRSLAGEEKYASIADGIRKGDYLKEMSAFGIQALNPDGSINDKKVRMYLDLKAQTVPAKPTETEPNASNAPTVDYTEVGEGGITSIDQAYKILMEKGNPDMQKAEEYIKNAFNPNSKKEK